MCHLPLLWRHQESHLTGLFTSCEKWSGAAWGFQLGTGSWRAQTPHVQERQLRVMQILVPTQNKGER